MGGLYLNIVFLSSHFRGKMAPESRYSRQKLVVGVKSQGKLSSAKVAIVGLGALGSVAAELLCRSGIGKIIIIDRDIVELSNLQRQILYAESDIGKPKAQSAFHRLKSINSTIKILPIITDISHKNIEKMLKSADIILDCTDNLYTRFLINDFAKKNKKPWVYAGCISMQGSAALLAPKSACFRCFTKETVGLDTCDTAGVLNTASAITASLQVQLALQWLIGNSNSYGNEGKTMKDSALLHHINLKTMNLSALVIKKNKKCPACNGNFEFLDGSKEPKTLQYQCSGLYQFFIEGIDLKAIEKNAKKMGAIKKGKGFLLFNGLSVFENGRILIRAKSLSQAKSLISRYVGL